jgi:hypothetical protein
VRLCYRLGTEKATGVLELTLDNGKSELLILRRGQLFTRESGDLARATLQRMEGLASQGCCASFEGGLAAYPPSMGYPFALTKWARTHLESQLDSARAQDLVRELAGARLCVVAGALPAEAEIDSTDRRILDAMSRPRRLDQIWPLARAPRFRLLCFVHFLRSVGAIEESGVAAHRAPPLGSPERQAAAMRTLGLCGLADRQDVKRAYRKLARQLHPDLNRALDQARKRQNEQRLATVNSAYRELMQPR